MLRIATAPVNWNNSDVPDWRPHVPFPAILDEMLSAGYGVTEYDATLGDDLGAIAAELDRRAMSLCGAYRWVDLQDDATFERDLPSIVERCRRLSRAGCQHLIVSDRLRPGRIAWAGRVPADGSLSLNADGFDRMAGRLRRLADACGAYGVAVHYHNHAGTMIETPEEVDALVARLPDAGLDLCLDTGHYAFGGGDSRNVIDRHRQAIGYLHLKDVDGEVVARARQQGWSLLDALRHVVFAPLGEGCASIPEIARLLVERRYDGMVVIEQDTCRGDPTATARANLDYLLGLVRPQPTGPDSERITR